MEGYMIEAEYLGQELIRLNINGMVITINYDDADMLVQQVDVALADLEAERDDFNEY
jgi:hypothetical protein